GIEEPARASAAEKANLLGPDKFANWERYERMHDNMYHRSHRGLERYEALRADTGPERDPDPEPGPGPEPQPEAEESSNPQMGARAPEPYPVAAFANLPGAPCSGTSQVEGDPGSPGP